MALRPNSHQALLAGLLMILPVTGLSGSAFAANRAGSPTAAPRIVENIDATKLVTLAGHVSPLASAKFDQGAVSAGLPLQHMLLQLRRSPEMEAALEKAVAERENPQSKVYHQWLTAEQLGEKYGPAEADIETVTDWLSAQGFQVNQVYKNGMTIDVTGTAGTVLAAFHTQIHQYKVSGKEHIANATSPQIPAALAPVVSGFVSLNNFMPKPLVSKPGKNFSTPCTGCPDGFDGIEQYDEAPADLATIYNVNPLYKAKKPITGKGQTVVVLERTNILPADVTTFRKAFGLSSYAGTFTQIHPGAGCTDPGTNADEGEAALDAEWAGAVAPDANVVLASCADTTTSFGPLIAAQNLLDSDTPPPIMSLSYGGCEAGNGPVFNAYVNAVWQQAASEGVSVFVSAGDSAAAGCDNPDLPSPNFAIDGIAANALGSTPYNLVAGGTDFLDTFEGANSTYWSTTNTATGKSVKSYVPEIPWNDSCGSNILYLYLGYTSSLGFCNSEVGGNFLNIIGGGGAPSFIYAKPYWQQAVPGIPNDGKRDLPDVSLFASNGFWNHAILFCMSDTAQGGTTCDYTNGTDEFFNSAGGTSFVAPQLASIQALINQKAGGPQGNAAPIYYDLAKTEYGTTSALKSAKTKACNASLGNGVASTCLFYDITAGNNLVPCYGTVNCYDPVPTNYGVLSTSDTTKQVAYPANTGWDFTTGLGTINVTNIVNSWP